MPRKPNEENVESSKNGPIYSPVDRFMHLPEYTRQNLEQMREVDWDTLHKAMEWVRFLDNVGTFWKWALMTVLGTFITAILAGEKIAIALSWLRGPPK